MTLVRIGSGLLFCFITCSSLLKAQPVTFSKVVKSLPTTAIEATSVCRTFSGDYLIVGNSSFQAKGLLIRVDSLGNLILNKAYYGNNGNIHLLNSVVRSADSNYYIAGVVNEEAFLAKVNDTGDTLWTRSFNQGFVPGQFNEVYPTPDGGCCAAGSSSSAAMIFVRLDANGNTLWSGAYSIFNSTTTAKGICPTSDGGFVITGTVMANSGFDHAYLLKLNSGGTLQWIRTYYVPNYDVYGSDVEAHSGGLYLLAAGNNAGLLMNLDTSGSIQWIREYAVSPDVFGGLCKVHVTTNNEAFFISVYQYSSSNFFLVDAAGNTLINQNIIFFGADVVQTMENSFVCVGNGPLFGISPLESSTPHIGLVKIDSAGNSQSQPSCISPMQAFVGSTVIFDSIAPGTGTSAPTPLASLAILGSESLITYNGCVDVLSIDDAEDPYSLMVSPNPFTEKVMIKMPAPLSGTGILEVLDPTGRLVKSNIIQKHSASCMIERGGLESGLYFIVVRDGSGVRFSGKVVAE